MTGKQCCDANDSGFTLVELLVALFVFALIASTSVGFLYQSLDSKKVFETRAVMVEKMRVARTLMKMDLLHLTARPTRGVYGETNTFVSKGGLAQGDEPFLVLVRGGVSNPGGLNGRSSLQHVDYVFDDGKLIRSVRARLDPASSTPVDQQVLLENVQDFKVHFLVDGKWQRQFTTPYSPDSALPQALAMTFAIEPYGPMEQFFLIAGAEGS